MELERWIREELTKGVEVNRLFPCMYDCMNGFGYSIMLGRKEESCSQQYTVQLTRKDIKLLTLRISHVFEIDVYKNKYEEQACPGLQGKHVTLELKEPSTYACEVSPFAITGTLTLKSEHS